jgi:hypothetical protein
MYNQKGGPRKETERAWGIKKIGKEKNRIEGSIILLLKVELVKKLFQIYITLEQSEKYVLNHRQSCPHLKVTNL